jgi:hypothetical protein
VKTSDVIRMLQEADPSGELDVCVFNEPVDVVERVPSHYNGALQRFTYDVDGTPKEGEFTVYGYKVLITTRSIADEIWNNPELPVRFYGLPKLQREYLGAQIALTRLDCKKPR